LQQGITWFIQDTSHEDEVYATTMCWVLLGWRRKRLDLNNDGETFSVTSTWKTEKNMAYDSEADTE
jgi:hypothetical protein